MLMAKYTCIRCNETGLIWDMTDYKYIRCNEIRCKKRKGICLWLSIHVLDVMRRGCFGL